MPSRGQSPPIPLWCTDRHPPSLRWKIESLPPFCRSLSPSLSPSTHLYMYLHVYLSLCLTLYRYHPYLSWLSIHCSVLIILTTCYPIPSLFVFIIQSHLWALTSLPTPTIGCNWSHLCSWQDSCSTRHRTARWLLFRRVHPSLCEEARI